MFEPIDVRREIAGRGESMLLCGDGATGLPELSRRAGKAQCVYLDPPFMTGETFARRRCFGEEGWRTGTPAPAYPAYDDRFADRAAYMDFLRRLVKNAYDLLSPTGVMYLHLDWRAAAYARVMCDEVFGERRFLNEIIWAYESGGRAKRYFSRKHDVILLYAKGSNYRFDIVRTPLERESVRRNHMRRAVDEQGRAYRSIYSGGREYRYYDDTPTYPGDVWTDVSHLQQRDPERTGYATQKPLKLLERLLRPVVTPGDLVCDLCCGSGTALAAAQALGCGILGVDASPAALLIARSRLCLDNMVVDCPCEQEAARLEGEYQADSGLMRLTGFRAAHPAFPETENPSDCLESWTVGRLTEAGFAPIQRFQRSRERPELPLTARLLGETTEPAVLTVDAAGRKRVYRWV